LTTRLLRGGVVFDGTSPEPAQLDVLITNDSIVEVGRNIPTHSASVIEDIEGLWLVPGFIDPHSHADAAVLTGETMGLRMKSGVTSEIVGQDGYGLAHMNEQSKEALKKLVSPLAGDIQNLDFADAKGYLEAVDAGAFSRVGMLSPHGAIRSSVLGLEPRSANSLEIAKMAEAFQADIEHGALGLSTALSYTPMTYSSQSELSSILLAAQKNRRLITHLRDYGRDFGSAIQEVIAVAQRSQSHLHFSHFHVSGDNREGMAQEYLDLLDDFEGTISMDSYPYVTSCTSLTAILPDYVKSLSFKELITHLHEQRASFARDLEKLGPQGTIAIGWSKLILKGLTKRHKDWNSRTISEIAKSNSLSEAEVVIESIVNEEQSPMILVPQGHESNVKVCASSDLQVVGSDGIFGSGAPHPRISESFTRFLALANSGEIEMSVSDAVKKMTSRTAQIFGLKLGEIKPGFPADIVIINPQELEIGSDFHFGESNPIRETLISGVRVVSDGSWTGKKIEGLSIRG
jgi:N-acyl-D-amino-acid deacylase